MRGLYKQQAQEVDIKVIDDVRNFLFGLPGSGGFDLAALNIQRGRDHGLASYNQTRQDFGLAPASSFADITSDTDLQAAMASVYASVDDVDVWVGGLAEDHIKGGMLGELFHAILSDQFRRLRDGDRFFYKGHLQSAQFIQRIESQRLSDIIKRNTNIVKEIGKNVFLVK